MANIGVDLVTILPDFGKYRSRLITGINSSGPRVRMVLSKQISSGMESGARAGGRTVSKQMDAAGKDAGKKFGGRFSQGFKDSAKGMMAGMGALFAVSAVTNFFKGAYEEANEAVKVTRLTEAVIKSTGGAAKISAESVGKLAESISNKVGVDDEAIQSGANMLLTFTRIRNETGKGNDIFNQATMAATNLSAAMGKDMKSSAMLVGKALNDPIKGMTALSRAGVQLTEEQKKSITTMVEQGDTMGAQKVLLKELETQFGGAAAAVATPGDKMKVAWANLQEQVGTHLMPVITGLMNFITEKLIPAAGRLIEWIKANADMLKHLGMAFGGALLGFKAFVYGMKALDAVLGMTKIGWIITLIAALVVGMIWAYHNVDWFRKGVQTAWKWIQEAIANAWNNWIKPAVNAMVSFWRNTLAPAISNFWENVVKPAWAKISYAIWWAWTFVIKPTAEALVNFWNTTLAPTIVNFYNNVVKPVFAAIGWAIWFAWNMVIKPIVGALVWYWNTILAPTISWLYNNVVKPIFTAIGAVIGFIWNFVIKPAVTSLVKFWNEVLGPTISWLYNNVIKPVWDKAGEIIKNVWEKIIRPVVEDLVRFWNEKLGPTISFLYDNVIKPVWDKIGAVIKGVWENVILVAFNKLKEGLTTVQKAFENAKTGIGKIWDGLKELVKAPVRFIIETVWNNGIVALSAKIHSVIKAVPVLPKVTLPKGFATGGIFNSGAFTKGFANGGTYLPTHSPSSVLPGYSPGKDNMLVPLSGGESIFRPEFSKSPEWRSFVARGNAAARSGGVSGAKAFLSRGYADGGVVGHPSGMPVSSRGLFLGGVFDWFGDTVGKVTGTLSGIVNAFKKNLASDVVAKLFDGIFGPVNELGKRYGWAGKVGGETMMQMKDQIVNWFLSFLSSGGGEGAEAVLNVARKEIGTTEPNNKKYNSWYGLDVSQPWCDMFVSWCAAQAKEGAAVGKFAYTPTHADFFAQRKQWHQGAAGAAPGDVVFFDWGGGSSRSGIDHVGFVEKANGGTLTTIEGNTSNAVKRMTRSGSSITGYGRPAYSKNGSGSGDNVGNGKYNGKAMATFFWDPQTADGGGMRNNTVASPTWPLGTQVRLGWDGRFVSGEVHDFGPADWVIRRNGMKQMVDLATPLSRALFGSAQNGMVSFAVTHVGSGATYQGRKPQWGSSLTLDQGGWMQPFEPYMNLSGRPEPVFNAAQWQRIEKLVQYVDREAGVGQTGGDTFNIYEETGDPFRIADVIASRQRRARRTSSLPPPRVTQK